MISADGGQTKLALFRGQPQGPRLTAGWHRVAFQVSAEGVLSFVRHAEALGLRLTDHETAISAYFSDPYGHRLEITTYDPGPVRAALPPTDSPARAPRRPERRAGWLRRSPVGSAPQTIRVSNRSSAA